MAGHSKFKNIMHRKGGQDKKRALIFSKLSREITVAAKAGLPDPEQNARLRLAVQNARAENMPKDTVQRAIDKAAGVGGEAYKDMRYEGFGPGGVGIIVEALTDNMNRTAADVRAVFNKNGGNLGTSNSVTSGFDRVGEVRYPLAIASEDAMLEAAIEAGADDVKTEGDDHVVLCDQGSLSDVSTALQARFGDPAAARVVWRPHAMVEVSGDTAQTLLNLVDWLDDLDDVQNVYSNFDISDDEMAKMAS